MVYKKFYFKIIIRVIILILSCLWFSFSIQKPEKIYTIIVVSSFIVIQVISLIAYINRTNRELARFFAALKDKDSSTKLHFNDNKGTFKELANILNEIAELIEQSRIESEKNSKYFEFVVEHIPTGIITLNDKGKIIHSNNATKKLLNVESISTINKINAINEDLANEIISIKPGDQKILRIKLQNQFFQILVRSTQFQFNNQNLKLLSLQDVKDELEENELVSWQKLIRVLTHEIMNSITPISTLTLAIKKCLNKNDKPFTIKSLTDNDVKDAILNAELIEERSKGLQDFVEKYRSLTKVQALKTSKFRVVDLLNKSVSLFKDEIQNSDIHINISSNPENLTLVADQKLIEQVMINLIKNAIESVKDSSIKKIICKAIKSKENKIKIEISDTGVGIPDEIIDQIFMPFFTTKEQGSGIGLSLARQIMRLHSGNISVKSTLGKEAKFTLVF